MPSLTEVNVSHSIGFKINLGNYESGDIHLSESERWDVSDLVDEDANGFISEVRKRIRERLEAQAEFEYKELVDKPEAGSTD